MKTINLNTRTLEEITNELLSYGFIQLPFCNIIINSSDYKEQIEARLIFKTEKGELLEQNLFIWKDQDLETQKTLAIKKFKTLGYEKLILVALFVKTPYRKSLSKIGTIVDNPYPMIVANNLAISVVPTYDNDNIHNGWFINSGAITDCTGTEPTLLDGVIPDEIQEYLNVYIPKERMDLIYKTILKSLNTDVRLDKQQLDFLQNQIILAEQEGDKIKENFTEEFLSVFSSVEEFQELWRIFYRMHSKTTGHDYISLANQYLNLLKQNTYLEATTEFYKIF